MSLFIPSCCLLFSIPVLRNNKRYTRLKIYIKFILYQLENPFFQNFVNILDPRSELPSRKQLSTKHLETIYLKVESNLREKLNSVEHICLTLDLWSNRQMRGFLGMTGHFILNWKLESVIISCKRVRGDTQQTEFTKSMKKLLSCMIYQRKSEML